MDILDIFCNQFKVVLATAYIINRQRKILCLQFGDISLEHIRSFSWIECAVVLSQFDGDIFFHQRNAVQKPPRGRMLQLFRMQIQR